MIQSCYVIGVPGEIMKLGTSTCAERRLQELAPNAPMARVLLLFEPYVPEQYLLDLARIHGTPAYQREWFHWDDAFFDLLRSVPGAREPLGPVKISATLRSMERRKKQLAVVRDLNAKGIPDAAIARITGRHKTCVSRDRRLLRLPITRLGQIPSSSVIARRFEVDP